jgi:hypothetical protein
MSRFVQLALTIFALSSAIAPLASAERAEKLVPVFTACRTLFPRVNCKDNEVPVDCDTDLEEFARQSCAIHSQGKIIYPKSGYSTLRHRNDSNRCGTDVITIFCGNVAATEDGNGSH